MYLRWTVAQRRRDESSQEGRLIFKVSVMPLITIQASPEDLKELKLSCSMFSQNKTAKSPCNSFLLFFSSFAPSLSLLPDASWDIFPSLSSPRCVKTHSPPHTNNKERKATQRQPPSFVLETVVFTVRHLRAAWPIMLNNSSGLWSKLTSEQI